MSAWEELKLLWKVWTWETVFLWATEDSLPEENKIWWNSTYSRGGAKRYWPMKWRNGIRASDIRHTEGVHIATAIAALNEPMKGNPRSLAKPVFFPSKRQVSQGNVNIMWVNRKFLWGTQKMQNHWQVIFLPLSVVWNLYSTELLKGRGGGKKYGMVKKKNFNTKGFVSERKVSRGNAKYLQKNAKAFFLPSIFFPPPCPFRGSVDFSNSICHTTKLLLSLIVSHVFMTSS